MLSAHEYYDLVDLGKVSYEIQRLLKSLGW